MLDPHELRDRAAQCMAQARRAETDHSRLAWIEMANHWLKFAAEAEAGPLAGGWIGRRSPG